MRMTNHVRAFFAAVPVLITLILSSCGTTPSSLPPDSAFDRAEVGREYDRALDDLEFAVDPFGWGAGR